MPWLPANGVQQSSAICRAYCWPKLGVPARQQPHPQSQATIKWFQKHNIKVVHWPARSRDFNPSENLLEMLVRKVYVNGRQFEKKTLKDTILKSWDEIEVYDLQKLILSMKNEYIKP